MGATTARAISPVKVFAVLLALVVALAFIPSAAYAVTSKTVKKQGFTTELNVIKKKAATVKKGTTKLTYKAGQGYLKFTATKTKKYKFTYSNVTGGNNTSNIYVSFYSPTNYNSITSKKVRTNGGKDSTLWLSANGHTFSNYSNALYKPIPKRAGTVKLKKGQTIYMYFNSGYSARTKAKLVIK